MGDGPIAREAVGLLWDEISLRSAVNELVIAGFDRADISVVAGRRAVERKLGAMYDNVADLEHEPEAPCSAYIGCYSRSQAKAAIMGGLIYVGAISAAGAMAASGGTPVAVVGGAAIAGVVGGLIGGAIWNLLDQHHAECVDKQVARGGIPLWVHTADSDRETLACLVLSGWMARNVHVHDIVRAA